MVQSGAPTGGASERADGGVLYRQQYRRCGKPSCSRCAAGGQGHGPYWYALWWEDGRRRTRYLGKELPPGIGPGTVADEALHVRTLGTFTVRRGDTILAWTSRRAAALFKTLLGAPGHRLTREEVIELLWPEADPILAAANLRTTVHLLRRTLDASGAGSHLHTEGDMLLLAPSGSGLAPSDWLDAETFARLAVEALAGREAAACRQALERYTGEYLPDDSYEPWTEPTRGHLQELHTRLSLHLARLTAAEGELAEAERCLRGVLEADAGHEEAAGALMSLLAASGRGSEALRIYGSLAATLEEELGVAPSAEVEALRARITAERGGEAPLTRSAAPDEKSNLPAPLTSFVGREWELEEIGELAGRARLVTLTGPGGCGKTRLAIEAGARAVNRHADGVWLVELAGLGEPSLVPAAVAATLGVEEGAGTPLTETMCDAWRGSEMLLLLDNCEHLLTACADLAALLLSRCPRLRVLATSREALGVAGEVLYRVPSLAAPDPQEAVPLEGLDGYEAIALFVARAAAQRPDFRLTARNAPSVIQICARLDGLPLAIELAAARLDVLSAEGVAQRLDDRFRLLTGGPRTALPRQQTLRATMDWSYSLLAPEERALLHRLAVFAGGWSLEAAEAVCAGNDLPAGEVLDRLGGLVQKSLVTRDDHGEETRYRMLETIRQYAAEALDADGETESMPDRHLGYFLELVERGGPQLTGPDQAAWFARLDGERHNLRRAVQWAYDRGRIADGLCLLTGLRLFWESRGLVGEARRWLESLLASYGDEAPGGPLRARALSTLGRIYWHQGDFDRAEAVLQEALSLVDAEEDGALAAGVLNNMAGLAHDRGDTERAAALYERALQAATRAGDRWHVAAVYTNLGNLASDRGDLESAREWLERGLAVSRELGETRMTGMNLNVLGEVFRLQGSLRPATDAFHDGLRSLDETGDWPNLAYSLECLARVARDEAAMRRAARLVGAADAIRLSLGINRDTAVREARDEVLADCERVLGSDETAAARDDGATMSLREAIAYGLSEDGEGNTGPQGMG